MSAEEDYQHMARALRLAQRGLYTADPNPRVGCVLVNRGAVVGEGFHARTGEGHAEVIALQAAAAQAKGATAYITLEPCCHHGHTPPCTEALIAAGIVRAVIAMRDPNPQVSGQGVAVLQTHGIDVVEGVMAEQAAALNPGFISRMQHNRPWVRIKSAISLDGRTAMASGESQWISGETARHDVQLLRARSGAVFTGIGTALADDPGLNVRLSAEQLGIEGEVRQPLRVVIDADLKLSPEAKLLQLPGESIIFTVAHDDAQHTDKMESLQQAGAAVITAGDEQACIDLPLALRLLAERGVNELQVEAGSRLVGSLFSAGLVDELVIYLAPHLMGDAAQGLVHIPAIDSMSKRVPLRWRDVRKIGDDLKIVAIPEQ